MKLYLVQHGESKSKDMDPDQSLTEVGKRKTAKTAVWMERRPIEISEIRHSGKKRAQQTAEIMAGHLSPTRGSMAGQGLNPTDDVLPVAESLDEQTEPVMIVGHLPFLSRLASLLLAGDPELNVVSFTNSGVVCLARVNEQWSVSWSIVPDLIAESAEQ
jgi:phosphohistidine phosphatase